MASAFSIDPAHTAVLSMDCQIGVVSVYVKDEGFLARAASVLKHARTKGMRVIHVKVGFRSGLPEVGAHNSFFRAIKSSPERQKFFEGTSGEIAAALAPINDEVVVTKRRVSAFTGTDLRIILRANEIDTLLLFGIATSGVVLSTLLDAVDEDFRLVVIKDCCADRDPELHECLVNKFFPSRATVLTAEEFRETAAVG